MSQTNIPQSSPTPVRPVVYGIGLYFMITALDSFQIGSFGSFLKILAFFPLALLLLEFGNLRLYFSPILFIQLFSWLLAVVSVFYSVSTDRSMSSVMTLTLNLVLVFALGLLQTYTEQEIRFLKKAMLLGGWCSICLMFLFADVSANGRLTLMVGSESQDQNYINGYYIYTFSYHCSSMLLEKKKLHIAPTLFLFSIVLMTGSRGALIAYVAIIFVHVCILFANSRHRVRNIFAVLVCIFLFFFVFDLILARMPEKLAMRYTWDYLAEKGTTGRTRIWRFFFRLFSDASLPRMLFGHGYGTSKLLNTLNGYVAHNLYLDNLITLGVVGVLLQLATQMTVALTLLRHREYVLFGAYAGLLCMCLSLSLVAYKPIWNIMMMTLIIDLNRRSGNGVSNNTGGLNRV